MRGRLHATSLAVALALSACVLPPPGALGNGACDLDAGRGCRDGRVCVEGRCRLVPGDAGAGGGGSADGGVVVVAASCARDAVATALAMAPSGGEVRVPAGTCTWGQQLKVTRPLTLRGAGLATVLRDDTVKDGTPESSLLDFAVDGPFRMTGFAIEGLRPDPVVYSRGHVRVTGTSQAFRFDDLTFRRLETAALSIGGNATGLVDHCRFEVDNRSSVLVEHHAWDGGDYGDSSWASPSTLGGARAVFVEDCTVINAGDFQGPFVYAREGARVVVRHCDIQGDAIFMQGTDSAGRNRAARQLEVYDNRFATGHMLAGAVVFEGGTGVVFGNTFSGQYSAAVELQLRRATSSSSPWGRCNGTGPFDQNSQANGYACLDMVGRGSGALLSQFDPVPVGWPQQPLDPLHVWGNTFTGPLFSNGAPAYLMQGRDFVSAMRPGYTPYTYPHPLTVGAGPSGDGGAGGGANDAAEPVELALGCGCDGSGGFGVAALALLALLAVLGRATGKRRGSAR